LTLEPDAHRDYEQVVRARGRDLLLHRLVLSLSVAFDPIGRVDRRDQIEAQDVIAIQLDLKKLRPVVDGFVEQGSGRIKLAFGEASLDLRVPGRTPTVLLEHSERLADAEVRDEELWLALRRRAPEKGVRPTDKVCRPRRSWREGGSHDARVD